MARLLSEPWGVTKTPSIRIDLGQVGVKTAGGAVVDTADRERVEQEVERLTGFILKVE